MYLLTEDSWDLLTVKTEYPSCQAKDESSSNDSWIHLLDRDFTIRIRFDIDSSVRHRM